MKCNVSKDLHLTRWIKSSISHMTVNDIKFPSEHLLNTLLNTNWHAKWRLNGFMYRRFYKLKRGSERGYLDNTNTSVLGLTWNSSILGILSLRPGSNAELFMSRTYFPKRRGSTIAEYVRRTLQTLKVLSSETANMKKLVYFWTANIKNYRQITLNTKPHSDPLKTVNRVNFC